MSTDAYDDGTCDACVDVLQFERGGVVFDGLFVLFECECASGVFERCLDGHCRRRVRANLSVCDQMSVFPDVVDELRMTRGRKTLTYDAIDIGARERRVTCGSPQNACEMTRA